LDENPGFKTDLIEKIQSGVIDWQHFVTICSDHLVLPTIYLKFKTHDLLDHIPQELSHHLEEIYSLNADRNKQILEQLQVITKQLNAENIEPIFLKGTANLLDGVYVDRGDRILGDIDILVPEEVFFQSAELLKKSGYNFENEVNSYSDIGSLKHYPRLIHPDFVAPVEVHRIPTDEKYTEWFNTDLIKQSRKEVSSFHGCAVPSDQNKIIHNFIHSQLSDEGFLFGFVSLRQIYDLLRLSKRFPWKDSLPQIKTKHKAIAYYAFADFLLGMNKSVFSDRNQAFQVLRWKHRLNQNSAIFYRVNRSTIFLSQRIFQGYWGQLVQALYDKKKRQYLSRRISDPKWYGDHVRMYTHFFKKNN